jgi:prephenate dehydrogenase
MDVLIVGAGAVGRWVGSLVDGPVAYADADRSVAESAAADTSDGSVTDLSGAETYDVVAVAVPIRAATSVIRDQAGRAEGAVIDVTGSMEAPLDAMAEVGADLERASFHPLFAPAHGPGRIAKSTGREGPLIDRITRSFVEAGNTIVPVEPAVHDDAMATVQGRVHAAILAFGLAADPVPEELGTPVYEDLQELRERVTGGSPGVYADIQETFDGIEALQDAIDRLAEADRETFEALYEDAG